MTSTTSTVRAGAGLTGAAGSVAALAAGAAVMGVALGARQTFGLFMGPLALEHGLPVGLFALAIALHNLVWGIGQPFAGAVGDRYGPALVVAVGALAYAAGLALTAMFPTEPATVLGLGVLVGLGMACTTFGVVLPAIGRRAPPERRSTAQGVAAAAGSLGAVLLVPAAQGLITAGNPVAAAGEHVHAAVVGPAGAEAAMVLLAGLIALTAPLGFVLARGGRRAEPAPTDSPAAGFGAALRAAVGDRSFRLLTLGFFTCGFQLAFIGTHLPGYLDLCHMPPALGATALAVIAFFNMVGSWGSGWFGQRFRPSAVLAALYLIRGVAIAAFLLVPVDGTTVLAFAVVMGLTWLGTVPLTNGVIARLFGVRYLGTLFGVCFLSHQVGSFLGAWLGSALFELSGGYTVVWTLTAVAGLFAAVVNLPIDDRTAAPG